MPKGKGEKTKKENKHKKAKERMAVNQKEELELSESDESELEEDDSNYKGKIVSKKIINDSKMEFRMYGFPVKKQGQVKEVEWQKKVVSKFFKIGKPLVPNKQSHNLYTAIEAQIGSKEKSPIILDGKCRRSLIIALSKTITKYQGTPNLLFQIGTTQIKLVQGNSEKIKADCEMQVVGLNYNIAYGDGCHERLHHLTSDEPFDRRFYLERHAFGNPRDRLNLLLKKIEGRLYKIVSFEENDFNEFGRVKLDGESSKNILKVNLDKIHQNIHFLNGLIFLTTVVEVIVRLYRTGNGGVYNYGDNNAKESDSLPIAIAQARSFILLLKNIESTNFQDLVGESNEYDDKRAIHRAKYGISTGKSTVNNLPVMLQKLANINEFFNDKLSSSKDWKDMKETYLKSNPCGYFVSGRSLMYTQLAYCYGQGDESDSESSDYSSNDTDLDVTPYKLK